MNIHFTNPQAFSELQAASIFSIEIGSKMYGTADEYSDTDILHIYIPSIEELSSFVQTHHQFQYKEEEIDHLFVNIFQFFQNSLSGDSTINFEVIHHPNLIGTALDWVYQHRHYFQNYKIIRSYLGMARRDLQAVKKANGNRLKNKRMGHVVRGYHFAKAILDGSFSPVIQGELLAELKKVKLIEDSRQRHEFGAALKTNIEALRTEVNHQLSEGGLNFPQYMKAEQQKELDLFIQKTIQTKGLQSSQYFSLLKDAIYQALEEGVNY
jgi:predicted nucleotidyltransferase